MDSKKFSDYNDDKIMYNHHLVTDPEKDMFELHSHDVCEVIFLKSGDVSAVIGGKTYKLHKNSIVIFRPQVMHTIRIDGKADYERFDILFDEKHIANNIFESIPAYLEVINYNSNSFVCDLFEKMDYYYRHFKGENLKILYYNLVEELVFNLSLASYREEADAQLTINPIISKAIDFIDRNYTENISIDDVSRALYISKRHLHSIFLENMHISPKKYINSLRLAKAQNLIRLGEKPSSVYHLCGFSDYATFYRNYVNNFGHTPSQEFESEIIRKIKS